mmetsp:Transcript_5937/g.23025  ORF Transcript_5937/g.23025 Transcript_5937/m.23025 type:complete len:217 (+) Transcript_5937:198-848(+)
MCSFCFTIPMKRFAVAPIRGEPGAPDDPWLLRVARTEVRTLGAASASEVRLPKAWPRLRNERDSSRDQVPLVVVPMAFAALRSMPPTWLPTWECLVWTCWMARFSCTLPGCVGRSPRSRRAERICVYLAASSSRCRPSTPFTTPNVWFPKSSYRRSGTSSGSISGGILIVLTTFTSGRKRSCANSSGISLPCFCISASKHSRSVSMREYLSSESRE